MRWKRLIQGIACDICFIVSPFARSLSLCLSFLSFLMLRMACCFLFAFASPQTNQTDEQTREANDSHVRFTNSLAIQLIGRVSFLFERFRVSVSFNIYRAHTYGESPRDKCNDNWSAHALVSQCSVRFGWVVSRCAHPCIFVSIGAVLWRCYHVFTICKIVHTHTQFYCCCRRSRDIRCRCCCRSATFYNKLNKIFTPYL